MQWAADIAAIATLLLPLLFAALILQDRRITDDPMRAVATVEEKRIVDGGGEGPTYLEVRYSFRTASGKLFHGNANVGQKLYDRLAPGGSLEVEYAADDPGLSRVPGEFNEFWIEAFAVGVQGLIFFWILGPRRWLRVRRGEVDPVLT